MQPFSEGEDSEIEINAEGKSELTSGEQWEQINKIKPQLEDQMDKMGPRMENIIDKFIRMKNLEEFDDMEAAELKGARIFIAVTN